MIRTHLMVAKGALQFPISRCNNTDYIVFSVTNFRRAEELVKDIVAVNTLLRNWQKI